MNDKNKITPTALTIAGSDSGGGAGIQADLKTFAAIGVYGMSAITSITAQNTREVRAIHDLPPEMVVSQIETVHDDIGIDAAKTGMLSNAQIIKAVAETIERLNFPVVVDPVMIAKSGAKLLRDDAIESLIKDLIPKATLITPNRMEAEVISGLSINTLEEAREAARVIVEEKGARSVIVKGGHVEGKEAVDVFYDSNSKEFKKFKAKRLAKNTTHGTGCSFAAAIAANLAKGLTLEESISIAKKFITFAIDYGLPIGRGSGPVNPTSWQAVPAERYLVLQEVETAVNLFKNHETKVNPLIPEVAMNIGMALPRPYARTRMDVAAIPGRIQRYRNGIIIPSKPEFGVSSHVARAILTTMSFDANYRAAANIAYNDHIRAAIERAELFSSYFDRSTEPEDVKKIDESTTQWGMKQAIERTGGRIPDAVFDFGEHGKEPLTIILGKSATEVARKIVIIAKVIKS